MVDGVFNVTQHGRRELIGALSRQHGGAYYKAYHMLQSVLPEDAAGLAKRQALMALQDAQADDIADDKRLKLYSEYREWRDCYELLNAETLLLGGY